MIYNLNKFNLIFIFNHLNSFSYTLKKRDKNVEKTFEF